LADDDRRSHPRQKGRALRFFDFIRDFIWSSHMRRARRFRRGLTFTQRRVFDDALREPNVVGGMCDYPDIFFQITGDNLRSAMTAAREIQRMGR